MANIQLAVEGPNAAAAVADLFAIDGITGSYEINNETQKDGVLAVIATIVGIVGGTLAIAEQIRRWYQEYRQRQSGKSLEKVVIIGRNGDRILLEGATVEDIQKILES